MNKTILKIQNINSWLYTHNQELKDKLWNALRFFEKGAFHSTAYKKGVWDGYRDFFNRNSGMFMTGLLPEVLAALKLFKVNYEILDERNAVQWKYDSIDADFLNQWLPEGYDPVTLHDYQVDYVNQALKYDRGLIKAPTGAGKTFILISILKCLPPNTPVLFMTKNSALVDQNYKEMKLWGVENLGRWYGGHKELNRVMCCISHPETYKSLRKLLPKFKVLIVDEVHECMSDVPMKIYKAMKGAAIRFGISATPFKFTTRNKKGVEECKDKVHKFKTKAYFGGVFKTQTTKTGVLTTKDLQERGILSKSRITVYPIDTPNNIQNEPYIDAITLGISNNFEFLKTIKRLAHTLQGRTLILVERIDQGEYLNKLIPGSIWLQGKDSIDTRASAFKELKFNGHDTIAIAMRQIITAGINIFIHNLINAAGGKAEHSIIQQMGRGLRCASDKDVLDYYDFLFRTNQYLEDHSMQRIQVLDNEGHDITIKESIDF